MKRYQMVIVVNAAEEKTARALSQRLLGVAYTHAGAEVDGWLFDEVTEGDGLRSLGREIPEHPPRRDPQRVLGVPSLPGATPPTARRRRRR